jgi:flagellin-like protein
MTLLKNEEAVSPIMGTILMVAITVILAAVIASYVFGSPANVQKSKIVGTTAQLESSGSIAIVYVGGQDDSSLASITITAPNGTTWHTTDSIGTLSDSGTTFSKPEIGSVMKLIPPSPSDWPSDKKHIIVVGTFSGGKSQIILDTFI